MNLRSPRDLTSYSRIGWSCTLRIALRTVPAQLLSSPLADRSCEMHLCGAHKINTVNIRFADPAAEQRRKQNAAHFLSAVLIVKTVTLPCSLIHSHFTL